MLTTSNKYKLSMEVGTLMLSANRNLLHYQSIFWQSYTQYDAPTMD